MRLSSSGNKLSSFNKRISICGFFWYPYELLSENIFYYTWKGGPMALQTLHGFNDESPKGNIGNSDVSEKDSKKASM